MFQLLDADKKLLALTEFLKTHGKSSKILVFLCSAAGVEYFALILASVLGIDQDAKMKILALHGKKKSKRLKIVSVILVFVLIVKIKFSWMNFERPKLVSS